MGQFTPSPIVAVACGMDLLPQTNEKSEMVPAMPNLVFREFIVALVLLAVLFTFGALFNAPLLEKANPVYSMNPTKAPWYFAGVQELLMHFHLQ